MGIKGACLFELPPPLGGRVLSSQFPRQLKKIEGISAEPVFPLKDLINITIPGVDTFCMKKTKSPGVKTKPALAHGTGYLLRHSCDIIPAPDCS